MTKYIREMRVLFCLTAVVAVFLAGTLFCPAAGAAGVTHTVTFCLNLPGYPNMEEEVNDGTCVAPYSYLPSLDGLEFIDWYREPDCQNLYDFNTPIIGDITLYAGWRVIGDEDGDPDEDDKDGDDGESPGEEDPEPPRASYSVTFCFDDPSKNQTQEVEAGGLAAAYTPGPYQPPVPQKIGHTFDGWCWYDGYAKIPFDFSEPILRNYDLYINWIPHYSAIVYLDADGADFFPGIIPSDAPDGVDYLQTVQLPALERIGYILAGWQAADGEPSFEYVKLTTGSQPVELYAVWQAVEYPIVLIADGTVFKQYEQAYLSVFIPPSPPDKAHYNCAWFEGENLAAETYTITGALTLAARYVPIVYKITYACYYDVAGLNPDEYTVQTETFVLRPPEAPDGMVFMGWFWDGEPIAELPWFAGGDLDLIAVFDWDGEPDDGDDGDPDGNDPDEDDPDAGDPGEDGPGDNNPGDGDPGDGDSDDPKDGDLDKNDPDKTVGPGESIEAGETLPPGGGKIVTDKGMGARLGKTAVVLVVSGAAFAVAAVSILCTVWLMRRRAQKTKVNIQ
ncbi:MAG: InlB B-repeat-containing protein [Firmicutes bacterium]|nr:InlB B-repeat-containing protein [Bacillota bacterium]